MRPVVHVEGRWDDRAFMRQLEDAIDASLQAGARVIENAAQAASSGYDIGAITSSAASGRPYDGRRGRRSIDIFLRHPLGLIFEKGRKRRPGVGYLKAGRFLRRNLREGRDRVMDELGRRLPG
jgi:hypothetical protein